MTDDNPSEGELAVIGDEASPTCIYCGVQLSTSTKPAHVWPAAIGGRLKSRSICCDTCNTAFSLLERALIDASRRMFASVGAVDGDGDPIAVLIEFEGNKFVLADGNAIYEVGGERFDRETKTTIVPLPAGIEEQSERLANSMWRHGRGPGDVERLNLAPDDQALILPKRPTLNEYDLSVGKRIEHKRVFVKMALELLAYHRHDLVLRGELSAARQFARFGTGDFRVQLDTRSRGSGLVPVDALPEVFNAIEVWTVGISVFYRIILLGPVMFTGTLTSEWSGAPFQTAYAFDARERSKRVVSRFVQEMGRPLATWFMRNEVAHCAAALEAISRKLAHERAQTVPVREAPPSLSTIREAVRTRLAAMPPKKKTKKKRTRGE